MDNELKSFTKTCLECSREYTTDHENFFRCPECHQVHLKEVGEYWVERERLKVIALSRVPDDKGAFTVNCKKCNGEYRSKYRWNGTCPVCLQEAEMYVPQGLADLNASG